MGEKRGAYRVLVGKPERRKPLGRYRMILKWLFEEWDGVKDWIDLAGRWRDLVNAVMNLQGSIKYGEFLEL
jgi:hypothetical protein